MKTNIRKYTDEDFDQLVNLLHDDDLGKSRESIDEKSNSNYQNAISEITANDNFDIYVMTDEASDRLIGCFQIMFLPHVSFQGMRRCQVESVRVRSDLRGKGLGTELMKYAINLSKEKGCGIFQLTSNKNRIEKAHKFYKNLGMESTHEGYKLYL